MPDLIVSEKGCQSSRFLKKLKRMSDLARSQERMRYLNVLKKDAISQGLISRAAVVRFQEGPRGWPANHGPSSQLRSHLCSHFAIEKSNVPFSRFYEIVVP